jgi:hypothetical protein
LGALRRRSPVLVEYSEKAQFWLCTKQKLNLGYEEEEARFCLSTQKKPNFGYLEEARFWFCTQRSPILGTKKKKLSVIFVLRLSLWGEELCRFRQYDSRKKKFLQLISICRAST